MLKSVPVLAIDIDDLEMKIVYASPLLHEMFGYGHRELIGLPIDVLLRPEDVERHHEFFAAYRENRDTRTMNAGVWVPALKKNGREFMIQVSLCTEPVGRLYCVIACIADVTAAYSRMHPQPFHH